MNSSQLPLAGKETSQPTDDRLPRSAYIHVPFCRHRCGYCNFTLVANRDELIPRFLAALEKELRSETAGVPRVVDTLFFGGGTPTHLPAAQLQTLLEVARRWFPLADGGEFSIEANPLDLLAEDRLEVLAASGVTRINLGVQSFADEKLVLLERDHRQREIEASFLAARQVAKSVGLDLIFATPAESVGDWERDLATALQLGPDHLSTYGLTWERGTQFWSRQAKGEIAPPDEETQRQQYELAIDRLTAASYEHYEVSNFARPGHRCRHNETYWLGNEYYAAGPGAARYVAGTRSSNHRSTTTWLSRIEAGLSPVVESESLSREERAREVLVFALRRLEGVQFAEFAERTGFTVEELVGKPLRQYVELGLMHVDERTVRLTRAGLLVSDSLWPAFLRS